MTKIVLQRIIGISVAPLHQATTRNKEKIKIKEIDSLYPSKTIEILGIDVLRGFVRPVKIGDAIVIVSAT